MKFTATILLFSLLFFGCNREKQEQSEQAQNETTENRLSERQQTEGWQVLFNGESLDGWQIFKSKENNSWEVADGALHCKPFDAADKRSDVMTRAKYEDFELAFEWKISSQGNSGVMFRVSEEYDEPYFSGPEYQVLDDKGYPGDLKDTQLTGSNYDMHAPPNDKLLKPVGEWNSSRIIVQGNHVEHWLNGDKLLEYEIGSEDWLARKNNSKWKDVEGYGKTLLGHIVFQDHGNEVWYKNIFLKPL